jgi:hypothetical protein
VAISGRAPGVVLQGLDLEAGPTVDGIHIAGALLADEDPPLVVQACNVHVGYDGLVINCRANPATAGKLPGGIAVRDCRLWGGHRGIHVVGAIARLQLTGNLLWNWDQAAIQFQDLDASARSVLLANNTACDSGSCLRIWDNPPYKKLEAGQVELANNLFFNGEDGDLLFILAENNRPVGPGDLTALTKLWRFRCNCRDASGQEVAFKVPILSEDKLLEKADLLSRTPNHADFLRPREGSALAKEGAGRNDPSLPIYIGAVPPEGVEPWNWDRTWRARFTRSELDKSVAGDKK